MTHQPHATVHLRFHGPSTIGIPTSYSFSFTFQARAQSATELSTSRRLKAELSRAFAIQQRQQAKGKSAAETDIALSHRNMPLGEQTGRGGGGGSDTGGGGSAVAKMPGLPTETTFGLAGAGVNGVELFPFGVVEGIPASTRKLEREDVAPRTVIRRTYWCVVARPSHTWLDVNVHGVKG